MNLSSFLILDPQSHLSAIIKEGLKIIANIALYKVVLFSMSRKGSTINPVLYRSGSTRFSRKSALKRINVRHLNVYNISLVDIPIHYSKFIK